MTGSRSSRPRRFSWPSRQALVVGCLLLGGSASGWLFVDQSDCSPVDAAFWFEAVTYDLKRLGGSITEDEMQLIASVARSEVTHAFAGLNITFSDRHEARYRVRVVQELRDMRFRREFAIPAESRVVSGFGGQGAVSFSWLAGAAVVYAPGDVPRSSIVRAIGTGIGRAAAHEFAHMLLPSAPIHDTTDIESYEYRSAARREQFFGDMHWDLALPLLKQRVTACSDQSPRRAA